MPSKFSGRLSLSQDCLSSHFLATRGRRERRASNHVDLSPRSATVQTGWSFWILRSTRAIFLFTFPGGLTPLSNFQPRPTLTNGAGQPGFVRNQTHLILSVGKVGSLAKWVVTAMYHYKDRPSKTSPLACPTAVNLCPMPIVIRDPSPSNRSFSKP